MYFLDNSKSILKIKTSAIKHAFFIVLTTYERAFCNKTNTNYKYFQFKMIHFNKFKTVRIFISAT